MYLNLSGIWPEGADGTDVNNVCRSNNGKILASADDFGKVNLYQYPCCHPKVRERERGERERERRDIG